MPGKKAFKVVIVGAGITGLALANMLEALGIDFVVLEGYKEIAPFIGASIVVQGTLARLLDQLGCWEDVLKTWNRPTEIMSMSGPVGTPWLAHIGNMEHIERRHGYPLPVIARRDLIRILYNNLKNKDKVLVEMRVEEVIKATGSVLLRMKGGATIEGDILVGADGVHSTVRKEMWRLAAKEQPGYFSEDELSKVVCQRMCMFGITKPRPCETPFIHFGANFDRIYLCALSTDDAVFWFCFDELKEEHSGNKIPRFTKDDEKAIVEKYGDDYVSLQLTLRDVHEDSAVTGTAAIIEHIYDRWHYKRILTIGDSAHSQNPIGGFGGASCLESAAALANALKDELEGVATSPREGLTDDDFNNMFTGIRSLRYERVKGLQNEAKQMASVFSLKGFLTQYIAPLVIIVMGQQGQLGKFATNWVGGVILKHLPKPKRRHAIPWNDELPAQPIKSVSGERVIKFLATSTLLISFYAANASLHTKHSAPYDSFSGRRPVIDTFTGIKGVDNTLAFLASFFSYSVVQSAQDPFPRLQLINLLSSLAPIYTIWTIEASRRNSRFSPITLPVIFTALAQLFTLGKVSHFYYLFAILATPGMNSVVDRQVPVSVSKAVLPAICLGYILPTALIFLPFQNDFISERLIAFWQFSPVIFAILAFLFAASLKAHDDRKALLQGIQEGKTKNEIIVDQALEVYDNSELNSLKATYAFVFSASALVHVTVVLYSWIDSGKSITTILASFMGLDASMPNPFSGGWDAVGPAESALTIFKFDMLFSAVPLLVFLLYTVWDIRKKGYITTPTAQKVAVAVITGQILVGPAATYAGLWYWRESVIAGLSQ